MISNQFYIYAHYQNYLDASGGSASFDQTRFEGRRNELKNYVRDSLGLKGGKRSKINLNQCKELEKKLNQFYMPASEDKVKTRKGGLTEKQKAELQQEVISYLDDKLEGGRAINFANLDVGNMNLKVFTDNQGKQVSIKGIENLLQEVGKNKSKLFRIEQNMAELGKLLSDLSKALGSDNTAIIDVLQNRFAKLEAKYKELCEGLPSKNKNQYITAKQYPDFYKLYKDLVDDLLFTTGGRTASNLSGLLGEAAVQAILYAQGYGLLGAIDGVGKMMFTSEGGFLGAEASKKVSVNPMYGIQGLDNIFMSMGNIRLNTSDGTGININSTASPNKVDIKLNLPMPDGNKIPVNASIKNYSLYHGGSPIHLVGGTNFFTLLSQEPGFMYHFFNIVPIHIDEASNGPTTDHVESAHRMAKVLMMIYALAGGTLYADEENNIHKNEIAEILIVHNKVISGPNKFKVFRVADIINNFLTNFDKMVDNIISGNVKQNNDNSNEKIQTQNTNYPGFQDPRARIDINYENMPIALENDEYNNEKNFYDQRKKIITDTVNNWKISLSIKWGSIRDLYLKKAM